MTQNEVANLVTNTPLLNIVTMIEIVVAVRQLPPLNQLQLEQLLQAHVAKVHGQYPEVQSEIDRAHAQFARAIPHIAVLNEIYNNVK